MNCWDMVKVQKAKHKRDGEAGVVYMVTLEAPDEVAVRFDSDGAVLVCKIADLIRLG